MSVISEVPGPFGRPKIFFWPKHDVVGVCWTHDTGVVRCTTSPRTSTSWTVCRTRRVVRLRWDRNLTGEWTKYVFDMYSIVVVKQTTTCDSCPRGIHTQRQQSPFWYCGVSCPFRQVQKWWSHCVTVCPPGLTPGGCRWFCQVIIKSMTHTRCVS